MIRMIEDRTQKRAKVTKVIQKLINNQNRMHQLFIQKLDFLIGKKQK
jgi:hypothetical protein